MSPTALYREWQDRLAFALAEADRREVARADALLDEPAGEVQAAGPWVDDDNLEAAGQRRKDAGGFGVPAQHGSCDSAATVPFLRDDREST